ncbi:piggyBac transposable element-derived protein 3-like [Schistocerca nitens]|uniref:piggyBac transposable element-derived protein 3-like n=1 Tax=Schistocerca nitens TaxID=7011 RepID=UPI0021186EBC|nr:piggyBac transposable element-derived protein 3-like [Schistocerca nitens]
MSSPKGITEDECYRILFEEISSSDSSVDSDENDPTFTTSCASSSLVCSRVVLNLSSCLHGKNHIIFMDNYFTSYDLFKDLKSNGVYACGTINPRRKNIPKLEEEKELERGEFDYKISNDSIIIYRWKDNRAVNLISTCHSPSDVSTVTRKMKDGTITNITCPIVLKDYNSSMNYVDNFDRLESDYAIDRKSKKWWMRLFLHFLDCSVTNAFIMHKEIEMEQFSNKAFRREVYKNSLAPKIVAANFASVSHTSIAPRIKSHKPYVDESIRHKSSKQQQIHSSSRRCAVCSSKKNPVQTVWMCSVCKVPLCLRAGNNCFKRYQEN